MNTMTMPGFTAEDSLYKTNGHYQSSRQAINSPPHLIDTIYPAIRNVGEEVIVIVDEWPPSDPWGWPGTTHGGTGLPSVPSAGGVGDGGGFGIGPVPKPKPTPAEKAEAKARAAEARARRLEIARCKGRCDGDHIGDTLKCAIDNPSDMVERDICYSIADNVHSRCQTRCQTEPSHNAPVI